MRYLLLLLVLITMQSCRGFYSTLEFEESNELIRQIVLFSHEMKAEHHLHLENAYYYENNEGLLETVYLEYWTQDQFEICKGRYIIVDIVEGILRRINEDSILRGARANLPFTPLNLEVIVRSTTFYGKYVDILLTQKICLKHGIVHFYAFDSDLKYRGDYLHEHAEEYETTLANVSAEVEATVPYYDKIKRAPGRVQTNMNYPPVPKPYPPISERPVP